ncbi:NFACT RNA binding domain-containing protein [Chlorobaculum limnaeum]|uniref:NFACT RNA binding domain-containing protein n=1 Tax=Chlorobaculum limnaeum TaxID=274537 RepID=UPI001F20382D|nr:NFACT RNA binding domain-containing protein [Chlorobaculum limnaeum]
MLRNYFTLYHAAAELHEQLAGGYLFEIHSQQKNEITLAFVTPVGAHLQLIVTVRSPHFSLFTREGLNRKSRNTAGIMSQLNERQVTSVAISPADRQISFVLDDGHTLALRMFSAETNMLLVREGRIVDAFKDARKLENTPFEETTSDTPYFRSLEQLAADPVLFRRMLEKLSEDEPLDRRLLSMLPGFDRKLVRRLLAIAEGDSPGSLHNAFVAIFYDLASPTPCVIENPGKPPAFSLFAPSAEDEAVAFDTVLDALNHYSRKMYRYLHLHERAVTMRRELNAKIGKLEKELNASAGHDPEEISQRNERYGHLLTGAIGTVEPSGGTVTVPNLFEPGSPEMMIPVKTGLNLQENAAWYFTQATKNRKKAEAQKLRHAELRTELDALYRKLAGLDEADSPDRLQQALETGSPAGGRSSGKDRNKKEKTPQFRTIPISEKITLYIGRNSANNEKLTFGFAKPDDIWLHARGASGSHCILKGAAMHNASEIRRAAEIAAWHSAAKHSELVPVICTQKKYLKKRPEIPRKRDYRTRASSDGQTD